MFFGRETVDFPPRLGSMTSKSLSAVAGEEPIAWSGTVTQVLPGTRFRVALANGHIVLADLPGKLRKNFSHLSVGDKVNVELSPCDSNMARIICRHP